MTDNSSHLSRYKKAESAKKIQSVKDVVNYLLHESEEVNINKVARRAQVSRAFIYKHEALKELIEQSRSPSKARAERKRIMTGRSRSAESKIAMINNLKRQLKVANQEIELLKHDNERLRSYIAKFDD